MQVRPECLGRVPNADIVQHRKRCGLRFGKCSVIARCRRLCDMVRHPRPVECVVVRLPGVHIEKECRPFQRLPVPLDAADIMTDDPLVDKRGGRRCLTGAGFEAKEIQRLDSFRWRSAELPHESTDVCLCDFVRRLLVLARRTVCESKPPVLRRYASRADPAAEAVRSVARDI
ncbi:hypothetical protein D1872_256530 [compost metagenome]